MCVPPVKIVKVNFTTYISLQFLCIGLVYNKIIINLSVGAKRLAAFTLSKSKLALPEA